MHWHVILVARSTVEAARRARGAALAIASLVVAAHTAPAWRRLLTRGSAMKQTRVRGAALWGIVALPHATRLAGPPHKPRVPHRTTVSTARRWGASVVARRCRASPRATALRRVSA